VNSTLTKPVWGKSSSPSHVQKYKVKKVGTNQLQQRKLRSLRDYSNGNLRSDAMSLRMDWGRTQEATAVLTALNYLVKEFLGTVVCEVGMCGAGLEIEPTDTNRHSNSSLLVGASPDAIIRGGQESLSLRCHVSSSQGTIDADTSRRQILCFGYATKL
jgi:hypothetical protein